MRDSETTCHCGAAYEGSDHCPECYCEQYESGDCGHRVRPAMSERGRFMQRWHAGQTGWPR